MMIFIENKLKWEIEELDTRAANIDRAMRNQMQVWETEKGSL